MTVYGASDEDFRKAVATILRGFEEGIFARSIDADHEPGWSLRLMPFIHALAVAQRGLKKCDCIASGNAGKPKQHGADPHAKDCAVYQ